MLRFARRYVSFKAGQPTFETRPHLIKSGDLTPGISAVEYFQRRVKLAEKMSPNSIAIIPGASIKYASGSVFHPFQQNNDLFYLTGWNEPNSICVLERPGNGDVVFHMAVPPSDPSVEQWEGERTGVTGAEEIFNADVSLSNEDFPSHLRNLLKTYQTVFYDFAPTSNKNGVVDNMFPSHANAKVNVERIIKEHATSGFQLNPLKAHITSLRAIKSNAELKIMRLAGKISGRAYNQAYSKKFKTEKGLHGFLEYRFISGGCDKSAYVPVVAGGDHALCIHYVRNDDVLRNDELVLVDAAGQLGGYCSDISRTWPVNGKFTPAQAEIYEAVLTVQKNLIKECTSSNGHSLNDIHNLSVEWMTRELKNCGFANLSNWETSKYLYPHYVGHNLGLDVHDCPSHPRSNPLARGQVITIEPGVYVPNDERWPAEFRGIGIRIEDDVAVGEKNYVVLTTEAAKEIIDIETIAASGSTSQPLDLEVDDIYSI